MSNRRPVVRGTLSVLAAAAIVLVSSPAWAHVEVEANRAQAGATNVDLTFHVPNEQAPASTRSVTFIFPADHPLLGVTTTSQNGFTPKVTTALLAKPVKGPKGLVNQVVRAVEFSGGQIAGTDEKAFTFHVDQLPSDTRALTFKALQTYSNGQTVSWIEVAADGAAEPEHPAPVLVLGGAAKAAPQPQGAGSGHAASPEPSLKVSAAPVTSAATGSGTFAPVAGVTVGGFVVVALGWVLWRRRRSLGEPGGQNPADPADTFGNGSTEYEGTARARETARQGARER